MRAPTELLLGGFFAASAAVLSSGAPNLSPPSLGTPSLAAPGAPASPADAPPSRTLPAPPSPTTRSPIAYDLSATLDEDEHAIDGRGTLRWTNTSSGPVDELYFHLYLNAFRSKQTLFFRSPFVRARGGHPPARFGRVDVESLIARELGGGELAGSIEPLDPEDGTDVVVKLPRAVASGESLTLDLRFRSVLPTLVDRTGYSRDFHFVAQWFPKLARLEPDGSWAHFAFHPHGEFYADFADYDVTLDVPAAMRVGATGELAEERQEGDRRVVRYRARSVIDFAWTAWAGFVERREVVRGVDVRLLYPPGHDANAERTLATVRFGLPFFGRACGPYPHATLTVVHPPSHAREAGGMEYPGLITTGGAFHGGLWSRELEAVTAHELAHQWFHALLASNEQRWPFLDEGLASYAQLRAMRAQLGPASASQLPFASLSAEAAFRYAMLRAYPAPIARPASDFESFAQIGGLVYARTALLLQTLENVYGEPRMQRALSSYCREQRRRHPTPSDLLSAIGRELGQDAETNLRRALLSGDGVDYAVESLSSASGSDADSGGPGVHSRVVLRRSGNLAFPIDVELTTASGRRVLKEWPASKRLLILEHVDESPVVSVVADPTRTVLVDDDLLNNSRSVEPGPMRASLARLIPAAQLALAALEP